MADDRDELIRSRAYELWEAEGSPHGRHDEHWAQAAQEIDEAQDGVPTEQEAQPATKEVPAPSVEPSQLEPTPAEPASSAATTSAETASAEPAAAKRGRKPATTATASVKGRRKKDG